MKDREYTEIVNGKRVAHQELILYFYREDRKVVISKVLKELNFVEVEGLVSNDVYFINSKDSRLRIKMPYSTKLEIEYGGIEKEVWFDDEDDSYRDYRFVSRFIKAIRECWEGVGEIG
jgi:hypothetical protein